MKPFPKLNPQNKIQLEKVFHVKLPEFAVEDLPSADLHPGFLGLQRRTCHWAEYSDMYIVNTLNKIYNN